MRREKASELFSRGFSNRMVAEELGVHVNTVTGYRRWHEEREAEVARGNPDVLRDVIGNTLRSLRQTDDALANMWQDYHAAEAYTTRATIMGQILKAQDQRAKLLGLMGVKQEWFLSIQKIVVVKDRLIEFMSRNLCPADRAALERLLTGELADYMDTPDLGHPAVIPVESRAT